MIRTVQLRHASGVHPTSEPTIQRGDAGPESLRAHCLAGGVRAHPIRPYRQDNTPREAKLELVSARVAGREQALQALAPELLTTYHVRPSANPVAQT